MNKSLGSSNQNLEKEERELFSISLSERRREASGMENAGKKKKKKKNTFLLLLLFTKIIHFLYSRDRVCLYVC